MSGVRKYPHLRFPVAGSTGFAHLAIPAKLQPAFNGKKQFLESTGEKNPARAFAIAQPMVAAWRKRLDEARKALKDPVQAELDRLRAKLQAVSADPATANMIEFGAILDQAFRLGGAEAAARRQALITAEGDVRQALASVPEPAKAAAAFDLMTSRATPFLAHVEAWEAANTKRGVKAAVAHVRLFNSQVGQTIEGLRSEHVQLWVDGMTGDAENTIRNRLYSVSAFWQWMTRRNLAPRDTKPFDDIEVVGRKGEDRARFEPVDVPRLWDRAKAIHAPLYHLVKIAAYTGKRREAVGLLTVDDVWLNAPVPHMFMVFDKDDPTKKHDVPIHSEILDLIRELVASADADGYLIHSSTKGEKRTDPLGKRFGKMKTQMGFSAKHSFHSIRHTFTHLYEAADAPENVCKDTIGHRKRSMTYGTYSGLTTLAHRKEWLEKVVRYPAI